MIRIRYLPIVAVLLLTVTPLLAQLDRATLTGTITDPSGLPLSGAKLTATQQGTGLNRQAVVPDNGAYTLPALPIGTYTVTVEASGFRTARFDHIELQVGTVRTLDIRLEVAGAAVEVQVMAEVAPLERTSAETGAVVK
jgi:hypothetical protein